MCSEYSNPRFAVDLESRLDEEFGAAIRAGLFSGASLLISRGRTPDFERTWGTVELDGIPVTPATRFDLASLTKPLVTAPLCMVAIERGFISLDDPLSRFFPGSVPGDKDGITIRSLLSHSSGLPPYKPFYLELTKLPVEARRKALVPMILQTPLDAVPGKLASYSDLGFMLLGLILERQMGARLDYLARDFLFAPLSIDELHFCPIEGGIRKADDGAHYAATQFCSWRNRLLFAEVEDENAWTLNGVSGHAGLFGTAWGVFGLLLHLWSVYDGTATCACRPVCGDGPPLTAGSRAATTRHPLWSTDIVRLFWTRNRVAGGSDDWCLGYDTPSRKGASSAGRYFSGNTIGHLGFTGVSFWLDLYKRVLVILLTNRVYPTRQNDGIRQFRPVLHDIIMESITDAN